MIDLRYFDAKTYGEGSTVHFHYHGYYEITYYEYGAGYTDFKLVDTGSKARSELITTFSSGSVSGLGFERMQFEAGSCVIYLPGTIHNKVHTAASKLHGFMFDITDPDLQFDKCCVRKLSPDAAQLITRAENEYRTKAPGWKKAAECILGQLCVEIKRGADLNKSVDRSISVGQAVEYINSCFLDGVDFEALARNCGYSGDRFRHLFKELTGMSPKQYVIDKRMEFAREQLAQSDLTVTKIAEICGYRDFFQFSAYFKKKYSVSPREYRKTVRETV